MDTTSTRRALIGAMIAAPVLAASTPANAAQPDRTAWTRTMAEYLAAQRTADHYGDHVWKPLHAEVERTAPRPALWFQGPPDRTGYQHEYMLFPANLHELDDHPTPEIRNMAAEQREAWHANVAARDQLGEDAAVDEFERLSQEAYDLRRTLIEMPAPDHAALWWKLDALFGDGAAREPGEEGDAYCGKWMDRLMADARRLLGGEVA